MGTAPVGNIRIEIETRMREQLLSVNFSVENELVVLLGRDGAGKTEILRSLAGVYAPERGRIEIQGRPVYDPTLNINLSPSERHVGWVPHISSLFPTQTVVENISFPFRRGYELSEHEAARRLDEILDLLQLSSQRHTQVQDLDQRLQQLVAIGRALVLDPEALLLDQPFRGFDQSSRRAARHDLQDLRRKVSVPGILATPDLEEAYEIADQIALLERGQLLQLAPPRTLVTRPSSREVADLVRSVNVFPGTVLDVFYDGAAVETSIGTLQVLGIEPQAGPVDVVIRPEHIKILQAADPTPADENVLFGELLEHTDFGALHGLTFHPDGAAIDDLLEISVSDPVFREHRLAELGQRRIILPPRAIHLMPRTITPEEPAWLEAEAMPDILTFDPNQNDQKPLDS